MTRRGLSLRAGPRLAALQGRLWWLLAGVGYGLGEWAMGHIVAPDAAREQRIWDGIQEALKDEDSAWVDPPPASPTP